MASPSNRVISSPELHREQRPGDIVVEAAVASHGGGSIVLHEIDDTGLSTLVDEVRDRHASQGWTVREVEVPTKHLNEMLADAQWDGLDIHFMTVDVEGAEGDVLASIDLARWRPWVIVVESTAADSPRIRPTAAWEPGCWRRATSSACSTACPATTLPTNTREQLGHDLSYAPSRIRLVQNQQPARDEPQARRRDRGRRPAGERKPLS